MSTIYLVRHGSTPANREERFAGRSGETLNSEGIEQMLVNGVFVIKNAKLTNHTPGSWLHSKSVIR